MRAKLSMQPRATPCRPAQRCVQPSDSTPPRQGFPVEKLDGADAVLIFATGSGISPIRAVIESGALEGKSARLFWGTRSPGARREHLQWAGHRPCGSPFPIVGAVERARASCAAPDLVPKNARTPCADATAYAERIPEWRSLGVDVVQVGEGASRARPPRSLRGVHPCGDRGAARRPPAASLPTPKPWSARARAPRRQSVPLPPTAGLLRGRGRQVRAGRVCLGQAPRRRAVQGRRAAVRPETHGRGGTRAHGRGGRGRGGDPHELLVVAGRGPQGDGVSDGRAHARQAEKPAGLLTWVLAWSPAKRSSAVSS